MSTTNIVQIFHLIEIFQCYVSCKRILALWIQFCCQNAPYIAISGTLMIKSKNSIMRHAADSTKLVSLQGTRQHYHDNVTLFSGPKMLLTGLLHYVYVRYANSIQTPITKHFHIFFLSLKLHYVVSLSRSYTLVACPALQIR